MNKVLICHSSLTFHPQTRNYDPQSILFISLHSVQLVPLLFRDKWKNLAAELVVMLPLGNIASFRLFFSVLNSERHLFVMYSNPFL